MRPDVRMANKYSRKSEIISSIATYMHIESSILIVHSHPFIPQPSCNSLHELDLASSINDAALSLVSSKGYWRNAWKVDLKTYEDNDIVGFSTPWSRLDSASKKEVKAVASHVVLKSLK